MKSQANNNQWLKALLVFALIAMFASCNVVTTENEPEINNSATINNTTAETTGEDTTQPVLDNASLISCNRVGMIAIGDSYADVEQKTGKENITLDSNYVEGKFAGTYNTLWKGSPMEIKVFWNETQGSKKVSMLQVENGGSVYRFSNGVKIGSTLEQLIKMNNGKPIRFYGFNWDYGGMIVNDGKGIGPYKCFSGVLNYSGNSISEKFMGDGEMNSSMPGIPLKQIYLSSITISAPQ